MRKPMITGAAALALLVGGCTTTFRDGGQGGMLALAAARAALAEGPQTRREAEDNLRYAGLEPYDADRNGTLSYAEWIERDMAPYLLDDTDGDGRLSAHEAAAALASPLGAPDGALSFARLDRDRDGAMTVTDLAGWRAYAFQDLDIDTNGKLTARELGITRPVRAERRIAVSSLIGLTPNEIRERLGLTPAPSNYVSEAKLDGDVVVTAMEYIATVGGCTNGVHPRLDDAEGKGWPSPVYVFRDNRLADVRTNPGRLEPTSIRTLVLRCDRGGGSRDYFDPITFMIVVPFLPFAARAGAKLGDGRRQAADALAQLRLGEPPPGGLMAYTASPPPRVMVVPYGQDEGNAEITINVEGTNYDAAASVRGGKVVALVAPSSAQCALSAERALRC